MQIGWAKIERGEADLGLGLRRVAGEIAARGLMPARFWWILGDGVSTTVCRKSWRSRGFGLRQGPRPGEGAGRGWRSSGRQCASAEHGCVDLLRFKSNKNVRGGAGERGRR
jgi:hypothetical protein